MANNIRIRSQVNQEIRLEVQLIKKYRTFPIGTCLGVTANEVGEPKKSYYVCGEREGEFCGYNAFYKTGFYVGTLMPGDFELTGKVYDRIAWKPL